MADRFVLARIQHLPLFDQLTEAQLEVVSDVFQAVRYEPGMTVFKQGQPSQGLMLIVSGRGVFSRVNPQGFEEQIGMIGAGEYINESALFTDGYESATLFVVESMIVLLLARPRFAQLLNSDPAIRANLRVPPGYGGQPALRSAQPAPTAPAPSSPAAPRPASAPTRAPAPGAPLPPRASIRGTGETARPAQPAAPPAPASSQTQVYNPGRSAADRLFKGQRDDETIQHIYRRHPWAYLRHTWIGVVIMAIFVVVGLGIIPTSGLLALTLMGVGVIVGGIVIAYLYFEWKDDFAAITDQRVVRVHNQLIQLENTISEIPLDRVLEVNVEVPRGDLLARLFNYGSVMIKTAGASGTIELNLMPDPITVQKNIFHQRDRYRASQTARQRAQVQEDIQRALGMQPSTPAAPPVRITGGDLQSSRGFFFARTRFLNDEGDLVYRKHFTIWLGHVFFPGLIALIGLAIMAAGLLFPEWILRGALGLAIGGGVAGFGAFWFYLADWDWRNDLFILGAQTLTLVRKRPLWLQNEVDTVRLGQVENVMSDVNGFIDNLLNRGVVRVLLLGADPSQAKKLGPLYDPQELQSEISRRQQALKVSSASAEDERNRAAFRDYIATYHQTVSGGQLAGFTPPTQAASAPGVQPSPGVPTAGQPAAPPARSTARDGIRPPIVPKARRDEELE
ncbi:MAG: cyclic nucleotide-binding domain-containing protein [bacterium]|nr:cyclic nucleotide-binding domain-containing protein [bacterium]